MHRHENDRDRRGACAVLDGTRTMSEITTPAAITTADAYAATDPARDAVVTHYTDGVVTKPAARAYATARMADAVAAGTAAMGTGDTDAALAAMGDASAWSAVVTELDAATRRTTRPGPSVADYVAATVSRAVAMRDAARRLATGDYVPADVPDADRDAYRDALRAAWADRAGVTPTDADTLHVRGYATRNAVSRAGSPLDPHLAHLWAATPVDAVITYATAARHRSDVNPNGIPNGSGRVGARFVSPTGDALPAHRWPTGWTYARTADGKHGMRRMSADYVRPDAPTDATPTDADAPADA